MTEKEFDAYLAAACEELETKLRHLKTEYGFGTHDNFVVEFEKQSLLFFRRECPVVEASILPIASHIPAQRSLVWFWSNRNLPDPIRESGRAVKGLSALTGFVLFEQPKVHCDESMVWEIAALACKYLDACGVYRIPQRGLNSYVLITGVRHF